MKKLLIWLPGMLSMLAACTEAVEIPARAPKTIDRSGSNCI